VIGVVAVGCQKEDRTDHIPDLGQASIDVTPRVQAFIRGSGQVDGQRSNTTFSLDSAEWYIEAGLNLSVAKAWLECSNSTVDSLSIEIPLTQNGVSVTSAHTAYTALLGEINELIDADTEHLIVADVQFQEVNASGISAYVLLQLGSGYEKSGPNTTYRPNDHIYYGFGNLPNNNCGCGPNSGGATQCADLRIQQRVRATLPGLVYPCYYTSVESRGVNWIFSGGIFNYPHTSFPTGNPSTPYLLYYCQGASCTNCLSPSKMSFYTQGMYDMMMQVKPAGKIATAVSVDDWSILSGENAVYSHAALFTYGILNCGSNG
jgi:hypothetical protein